MDDFTADILMRICRVMGASMLANLIDFRADVPEKKLQKHLAAFADKLEAKYKTKLFEFHDREKRSLIRYYIISVKEAESLEGEPMIIINDFPDGIKADKNPVLNLELVYDDVALRDEDLDNIKFLLK